MPARLMLVLTFAALLLAVPACRHNTVAGVKPNSTTPVAIVRQIRGDDPGLTEPAIVLVKSRAQLAALGSRYLLGRVSHDLENYDLVLVALGERPTAGYWADIQGVQHDPQQRALFVQARVNRPSDQDTTAQVVTHPFAAVLIPKTPAVRVRPEIESTVGALSPRPE
ncbi:MAG: protease complex subunit PrcB family protein [Phycisphaeraceae bacterium]|nr:protease complex subunit PrcB family protein [Phycisphaeraceae bacterium]